MRAIFIFEKFTEDSDPIGDMGIGIKHLIIQYYKEKIHPFYGNYDGYPKPNELNFNNTKHVNMLVNMFTYYYTINKIDNTSKQFIEYLTLYKKPKDQLRIALESCNLDLLKTALNNGAKISTLNPIYKNKFYFIKERKEIFDYLRNLDKQGKLEDITTDAESIRKVLGLVAPRTSYKQYPKGYKMYRVLKYIDENDISLRKDIQKIAYELSYGKNTFHPIQNAGYWGDAFFDAINPRVYKDESGIYRLNSKGIEALNKFKKKFEKLKIDALV